MAQSGKILGSRKALRAEAKRRKRKINSKPIRLRYLIACEGEETEPKYFKEIEKLLPRDVVIIPKGDGRNTLSLIDWAEKEKEKLELKGENVDEVWIVMDRDSFPAHDFDNAIKKAESKSFKLAWSNECFELWVLLHFEDIRHSIHRKDIYKKLSKVFGFNYEKDGKALSLYSLIRKHGGDEALAISRAQSLWSNKAYICSQANPATGVFELVTKLNDYI